VAIGDRYAILAVTALGSNVIIPVLFCQSGARLAMSTKTSPRLIAILAFEGTQLLDVAGPMQTFASANEIAKQAAGSAPYRIHVVSRRGGAVDTSAGLPLLDRSAARSANRA
jgi:transcriptional regulator GlxA family with amidase domain